MGYSLSNRLEVSIFINDQEYPLDKLNLLNALHITTTVRGSLPLLTMSITDVTHSFDRLKLQDGIPIRVTLKPNGQDTRVYRFRKFDHKSVPDGGAFTWTIYAYWDAAQFWNTTTAAGIQGTSNDVLQQIAGLCGLKYDGTATNDPQLWMPKNKAYRMFAKDIVSTGYVNDTSCMVAGVDLDATLRYKNVNALPKATKRIVAYRYEANAVTAVDVSLSASSGFNNAVTGYQNMRYVQSSIADDIHTQLQDLEFTRDSTAPLYNTTLKDKLGRGPVRFGPIDVGNVHENYERASYQNLRYRNLFSMGIEVLVSNIADFQLLEQVNFSAQKEDLNQNQMVSGDYTVSGHSIYVQGANYFEKLGLTRHGTNEKNTAG